VWPLYPGNPLDRGLRGPQSPSGKNKAKISYFSRIFTLLDDLSLFSCLGIRSLIFGDVINIVIDILYILPYKSMSKGEIKVQSANTEEPGVKSR
jgi:hypothetical protein